MGNAYWIGRQRASMAMAKHAATSEARLIHYDLAGRYSVKAAHRLPVQLRSGGLASSRGRNGLLPVHPPRPGSARRDGR